MNLLVYTEKSCKINIVIPLSYVISGSETGDITWDDISQDSLSHKCNVKIGRVVPDKLFWPRRKKYIYTY
jgi:hypothetical protein